MQISVGRGGNLMNPESNSPVTVPSDAYTYFAFISYKHNDERWAR